MKCPKCGYVGFEAADRCRHCGYEFSLIESPAVFRGSEPSDVSDQSYRERIPGATPDPELARADAAPLVDLPLATGAPLSPVPSSLFGESPPPARTPLAVRRTTERPRSRATPHVVRRSRDVLFAPGLDDAPATSTRPSEAVAPLAAPAVARVVSALLDIALLGGIDVAVVYLTAQMAGLPLADAATLPLVPLCVFVFGLNVAYVAVFTANGGQTLGKMAMGLRVEATEGVLTFGGALVRVAAVIVGGLVMGAGFLPALWRADRRAVHDRIAHTRVVKVGA